MFTKLLAGLSRIGKIIAIVSSVIEIVGGILEAARSHGYQFPNRMATA